MTLGSPTRCHPKSNVAPCRLEDLGARLESDFLRAELLRLKRERVGPVGINKDWPASRAMFGGSGVAALSSTGQQLRRAATPSERTLGPLLRQPARVLAMAVRPIALLAACMMLVPRWSLASPSPYPPSRIITEIAWDFSTVPSLRRALGSDLWPSTWASDGNMYAAWGDGGGFDGNDDHVGRASLGFARIRGTPIAGDPASYSGKNVWGQAPAYAENQALFGGKVDALIAIDGVLYAQGSVWTTTNCHCADPTKKNDDNPLQPAFMWSTDLAKTWRIAPWDDAFGSPLQFGQDYAGSLDPNYVYLYYQRDVSVDPTHIFLRRVLRSEFPANPVTRGHFQYFSAIDAGGEPRWTTDPAEAEPVFF